MSREDRAQLEALQARLGATRASLDGLNPSVAEARVRERHAERLAPLLAELATEDQEHRVQFDALESTLRALEERDREWRAARDELLALQRSEPVFWGAHAALSIAGAILRWGAPALVASTMMGLVTVTAGLPRIATWLLCIGLPIAAFGAAMRRRVPRTLFRDRLLREPPAQDQRDRRR